MTLEAAKGGVVYRKEDKHTVVSISVLHQNYTLLKSPSQVLKITSKTMCIRGTLSATPRLGEDERIIEVLFWININKNLTQQQKMAGPWRETSQAKLLPSNFKKHYSSFLLGMVQIPPHVHI